MSSKFTFIDLFAGIGGFHIAMHRLGGECIFASEIDESARKTYEFNHQKIAPHLFLNQRFNNDIRNIMPADIPDFDILCAGFPCQPFSQAGYKRGFNDNHKSERGNLFFTIAEIIEEKKPKAFFLENVRGLVNHDGGKTFQIIRELLENELHYSFYYKIVNAKDYGLPQLRPRVFMVGFRDEESLMRTFNFPQPTPLKYSMSDVWGGKCSREIGFTLRVGGRGSNIDDRRNWDAYLVDDVIKKLTYKEAQKMQGFPDDFHFPVSNTQAIKQLGNSVAIDAIEAVGGQVVAYMNSLKAKNTMKKTTFNKGEWSELFLFVKLLVEQQVPLADKNLMPKVDFFKIHKVTTQNLNVEFLILDKITIEIINKSTREKKSLNIANLINKQSLNTLAEIIRKEQKTFEIPTFKVIQDALGFHIVKSGNSNQKSDISLDISNTIFHKQNEGFSIKSYLGSDPTLLNASGNTNFIFEIEKLEVSKIDEINAINTKTKLKDRIEKIEKYGGVFRYVGAEKETMTYNLKMVDSLMPEIMGHVLLAFYKNRINTLTDIVDFIDTQAILNRQIQYGDKTALRNRIQKLLVDVLLGFFAGSKWDGTYEANGSLVLKNTGECVAFHLIDLETLKNYLYENIKLDTPSTTRHRFGQIFIEKNGKLYFKLNLQLRFK